MMKTWTRAHTLIAGAALIVLTNAVALGGAYFNRSGEAEARVALTERELGFGWESMDRHENSGLALRLNWRVESRDDEGIDYAYSGLYTSPAWLDQARMAALGFDVPSRSGATGRDGDCDRDGDCATERRYRRQLTRQALLVLEYDGPSWQGALVRARTAAARHAAAAAANPGSEKFADEAKSAAKQAANESSANSRLFAVDAGTDAAVLRARYPDRSRYLILTGQVRPVVLHNKGKPIFGGSISEIAVDRINVPLDLRAELDRIRDAPGQRAPDSPPRYDVRLATGQRLEPWIEQVRPLPAAKAD
ncbi:MAG: DUF4824 family protein [Sterolibacteriaceae bacterium]|nr:DUF4824 family protein [Candidatus Methylophosphatis haderslevensis]